MLMHSRRPYLFQCEKWPGMAGHLELDAQTFASWDIDYLKVSSKAPSNVHMLMPGRILFSSAYLMLRSTLRTSDGH